MQPKDRAKKYSSLELGLVDLAFIIRNHGINNKHRFALEEAKDVCTFVEQIH